jgi:hypothetical protein
VRGRALGRCTLGLRTWTPLSTRGADGALFELSASDELRKVVEGLDIRDAATRQLRPVVVDDRPRAAAETRLQLDHVLAHDTSWTHPFQKP